MAKKRKSRGWLIAVIIIVGLLAVVALSKQFLGGEKGIEVDVAESERRTLYAKVSESGIIQPTIEVPLSADVSGEVVAVLVKEGMEVKKGDLLMTIQPDDYKAALEQAQAALNQTRSAELQAKAQVSQMEANVLQDSVNLARTKQLYEDKVLSLQEWEAARLKYHVSNAQLDAARFSAKAAGYQVESAKASLKQAKQALDRTNIYATMDGTVTSLSVELGQRVVGTMQMAGTEILKIADLSSMEVVVEVNENDIISLQPGDSTKIEVEALSDQMYYGEVTDIAYSASMSGIGSTDQVTNFEVKVRIAPESYGKPQASKELPTPAKSPFRPGMTALVEMFTDREDDVVTIPIQAVTLNRAETDSTKEEPAEIVFVYDEAGTVRIQEVVTGISDDDFIHIREGLDAGETIVTGPYTALTKQLKEGTEVIVR